MYHIAGAASPGYTGYAKVSNLFSKIVGEVGSYSSRTSALNKFEKI